MQQEMAGYYYFSPFLSARIVLTFQAFLLVREKDVLEMF